MAAPDRTLTLGNRYRLTRLLSHGAGATRWAAHDDVLDRDVAATVLTIDAADPEAEERFRRDAAAAAGLRHPHLVATLDAGVDGDTAFVIEELVEAATLREVLAERGALPPARAVAIATDVCAALEAVHAAGRTHRGLHADNVIVCPPGSPAVGSAKLAEVVVPGWTARHGDAGDSEDPSPRADLAAVGALLYEVVTGAVPSDPPVSPRRLRAGVPRELEVVILRALGAFQPPFASATDLRHALLALDVGYDDAVPLVEGDPTPPSGTPVSFREAERRWLAPALLLLFVASSLAVLAVALGRSEVGSRLLRPRSSPAPVAIAPTSATSYDPDGDGAEKEALAPLVIDGDESTAWRTERYRSPLPRLKRGVGVVLQLDASHALERATVVARSHGWEATVYVSDGAHRELLSWGAPRGRIKDATSTATIDLDEGRGTHVLVWFTDLGPDRSTLEVAEIALAGRAGSTRA